MVKGVEKGNNLKIENFVKIKVYFPLKVEADATHSKILS